MKAEQGYVHIPATAGTGDGLTITPSERDTCARCGVQGGDMVIFAHTPERCGCLAPGVPVRLSVHVSCMEALTYMYRTGRKPRTPHKGGA